MTNLRARRSALDVMGGPQPQQATAKAPGKIILTGEHFVVRGGLALAGAVDRYVRVTAVPSDRFSISFVNAGFRPVTGLAKEHIYASIKGLLDGKGVRLTVGSDLPIGAGLGSSASSCVAAVLAVSRLFSKNLSDEEVFMHAMEGERMVHNNPSGIDVMVSIKGGFLLYRKGERPIRVNAKPLKVLLVDTGQRHKTGQMVKMVGLFAEKNADLFDGMTKLVDSISSSAAKALSNGDLSRLGSLLNLNQELLKAIGVSTGKIESIIKRTRGGSFGGKLTGGGGGGFVINIPKGNKGLDKSKYNWLIANVGVDGATIEKKIHKNGSGT